MIGISAHNIFHLLLYLIQKFLVKVNFSLHGKIIPGAHRIMDDHFIYVVISTYVIDRFQKDQTGTALICFVSDGISGRHKFYSAVLFQFL